MLEIRISPRKNRSLESSENVFIINGKVIEHSWALSFNGENSGGIYDADEVDHVLSYPIFEILQNVSSLAVPYEPTWCDEIEGIKFLGGTDANGKPTLYFEFSFESEEWARLWSIAEFAKKIEEITSRLAIPRLSTFRDDTDFITNGFGFSCLIADTAATAKEEINRWTPSLREVITTALYELTTRTAPHSVTAAFRFPEAISVACSQYLIYFGQFLADIGIDALINLSEDEDCVLFSVTPQDSMEALETIRSALDAYLKIPGDSTFLAESSQSRDIAVLQLRANVSHLKGQLSLAHAIVQAKDATIQALQLSNFQLQQITPLPSLNLTPDRIPQAGASHHSKDSEAIIEGLVSIRDSEIKGVVVHWPELVRRLKRKFRRGKN